MVSPLFVPLLLIRNPKLLHVFKPQGGLLWDGRDGMFKEKTLDIWEVVVFLFSVSFFLGGDIYQGLWKKSTAPVDMKRLPIFLQSGGHLFSKTGYKETIFQNHQPP